MEPPSQTPPAATDVVGQAARRSAGLLGVLYGIVGVLVVSWLVLTYRLVSNAVLQRGDLAQVAAAQENYHAYDTASALLKRGSDILTEAARRYAISGDRKFLLAYFREAEEDRHRDRALEIVDAAATISPDARALLHAAMQRSVSLMERECQAMLLVAEADGLPAHDIPEALHGRSLSPGEAALSPEDKRNLAVRMLFDDEYFSTKADIWDHVNDFLDKAMGEALVHVRTKAAAAQRHVAGQTLTIAMRLVVLFLLLGIAVGAVVAVLRGKNRANLRLMEELRHERDATIAAEKAKSMFFSMVSHDIRTPLNSIIGFSELLRDGVDDPEERAAHLGNILFSAETLLSLVNDVLDLSKLDAEKMKFTLGPCDVPALLARVADAFRFQTQRKGTTIRAESAPMPPLMLDEERIRQVVVNLASNAVKFTDRGGVVLRAAWEPVGDGAGTAAHGILRLEVSDTGIGIAPADQARVLEPFVQVEGSRSAGGTGLGLPICRKIAEHLGGSIALESEPGRGTTFRVVLPAYVAAPAAAPAPAAADAASAAASKAAGPLVVHSALVVDDVPMNLLVEKALLRKAGVGDVVTAPSAKAALDALRSRAFDVVLTDLWMPEMDGEALCAAIRADAHLCGQPVYAVTADVEAQKTFAGKGFDGVLLKPITAEALGRFLSSPPRGRHAQLAGLAVVATILAAAPAARGAPLSGPLPWERYQPIVDRAPFGAIYDPAVAEAEAAQAAAEPAPVVPEGPSLADTVKVSAITVFGGQPAAGFTDTAEGKSYYLYAGKSAGEFTLVDVMPESKAIVLRKGAQEETLYLAGAAPGEAVTPQAPAATPAPAAARPAARKAAGRSPGYADLQRKRVEEARALARQKAEEERQKRIAELEAMTDEERDRDLRDKNIEIIVSGDGPPLPIELNRQDLEILAEKGFDVTDAMQALDEKEAAEAAEPPNERIRRIRERRAEARRRRALEAEAAGAAPAPPPPAP